MHLHAVYQVYHVSSSASVDSEEPLQTVSSTTGRFVQSLLGRHCKHISLYITQKRRREDHNRRRVAGIWDKSQVNKWRSLRLNTDKYIILCLDTSESTTRYNDRRERV